MPEEYGLDLIRHLPQADLLLLKATLERITKREPTSPRERATRTRLTTFLAEVRQRIPPGVSQSSNTKVITATAHGPSRELGSSIRSWHPGKVVMLWAATIAVFYIRAHTADWSDLQPALTLLTAVSLGVSVVVTWKWLSAREARNDRTSRDAGLRTSPEQAGSALAIMVTCFEGNINGLLDHVRRHVPLDEQAARLEAVCLGASAVHYGAFSVLESDSSTFSRFQNGFYSTLREHTGLRLPAETVVRTVRQRGEEYAGALALHLTNEGIFKLPPEAMTLHFSDNPVQNVGKLFAHFCREPLNPIVVMAGAALFQSALEASRDALSEMGLGR